MKGWSSNLKVKRREEGNGEISSEFSCNIWSNKLYNRSNGSVSKRDSAKYRRASDFLNMQKLKLSRTILGFSCLIILS